MECPSTQISPSGSRRSLNISTATTCSKIILTDTLQGALRYAQIFEAKQSMIPIDEHKVKIVDNTLTPSRPIAQFEAPYVRYY